MKILLIEDDQIVAQHVVWGLGQQGFEVIWTESGLKALEILYEVDIRLIVLDLMLPRLTGWSFLKLLSEEKIITPVLILSALDQVEHRVRGLEEGADDYLVKPFSLAELTARIRAILRRNGTVSEPQVAYKDLELDQRRLTARRGGKSVDLTPREYALMALLLELKGQVLSRGFLLERVWDFDFASDGNVVDVAIRRLRSKIDEGFEQKLIHTVRGRGYVLR